MTIKAIHSFLAHPAKHTDEPPAIGGAKLKLSGRLYDMLAGVYGKSEQECAIEISFDHSPSGAQKNSARDLIVDYIRKPSVVAGRKIAERLQGVTTHRSGLGLLFLIAGSSGRNERLVVSRFPADNGILAEERKGGLTVEFLERIFMKSATSYKAALYDDSSFESGFWDGRCVDKQINSRTERISDYWIKDFLASDFKTTSAAGTRRFAIALRKAIGNASDPAIKEELFAAARLARSLHGRTGSVRSLAQRLNLSEEAQELIEKQIGSPRLAAERFTVSREEFDKHVAFATVELDNGGILTADASKFDHVFRREQRGETVRFSTEGAIVDQRVRQTKR